MITWIEGIALACGLIFSALLVILPRFGPGSRRLLFLLIPVSLSAGVQVFGSTILGSPQDCFRLSLGLNIVAAAGGHIAINYFRREPNKVIAGAVWAISIVLFSLLYLTTSSNAEGKHVPDGYLTFGYAGYLAAIFLLVISVVVLANMEQIFRHANETVRWELKFLLLGIGTFYAAIIYMSSQVLLFPPRSGLFLAGSIGLLYFIFIISCGLIVVSWERSSGQAQIAVSHGAIYSSITLLSVGVYLIASSLIARWVEKWGSIGLPTEAMIFFLSALGLAALLMGTGFRHRTRAWIRRNIFGGRYDYRQFWLEATERVRSIDPPDTTAGALADIVHRALGAIDVSIWIRLWNPNRLHMLNALGAVSNDISKEVSGVVEEILNVSEPISLEDLKTMQDAEKTKDFVSKARASLLVPLLSSNRIVGVIAVGSDRSGRPYDWEAREFLRALGGHAAGEFHKSDLLATLVEAKEAEAFRTFSTFVLHDLKNFASTLSYIAQNAPRHQHNPDFQKDAFQSVFDTAEKMKRLCNSLRTFSSTLAAEKTLTDLNQVVQSMADTLNAGMSKHLKLELNDLPPVLADPEEVKRVLQNLLLNAREAIADDGVIIVQTVNLEDRIEVSIHDNGKGMKKEFIEKELFLPFHTTKSAGLGIGLFQSKKIMEAHQGSIKVDSEEGKGTKVSLIFPASKKQQISEIAKK